MKRPEDLHISWWRPPIERSRLRELTRRSNARGLIHSFGILALWATTGTAVVLAWQHLSLGWLLAALFLHGTFYSFSASATHEMGHGTVFESKWLNEVFLRVFAFLSVHNNVFFRESHRRHHACTLNDTCDGEVTNPDRFTFWNYLEIAIVDIRGFAGQISRTVRYAFGNVPTGWPGELFPEEKPKKRRHLVQWARILLVGHATLAAVSIATGFWIIPILVTCGRFYGNWLHRPVNLTQHLGLRSNIPDWRIVSRTFYAGPLLRFLYWNMNYHIEHHTFAAVPFFTLGALHEEMKHYTPDPKHGLIPVWREIIQVQRRRKSGERAYCETQIPKQVAS